MRKTWFTADQHFWHSSILKLSNRPFESIEEHNAQIIERHNSVVAEDDIVYNLGDVSYRCPVNRLLPCLRALKGKHIFLFGNHDQALREAVDKGFLDREIKSGKFTFLGSTDPDEALIKTIRFGKKKYLISHYSLRSWNGAFRGVPLLFGHSHNNLSRFYKSMDVGVDTNDYFPWSYEDIRDIMDLRTDQFKED